MARTNLLIGLTPWMDSGDCGTPAHLGNLRERIKDAVHRTDTFNHNGNYYEGEPLTFVEFENFNVADLP